tara:strand:- start:1801 stop:1953 length:153 start_codon:yes stop_codon:yes gene_type:complete
MNSKKITIDLTPNYENIIKVMEMSKANMSPKQWEKSAEKRVVDECLKSRN